MAARLPVSCHCHRPFIPWPRDHPTTNSKEYFTMKITVFGASGKVGSRIVAEAIDRGHEVTAVVRDATRRGTLPDNIALRSGNIANAIGVAKFSKGQDVIINATRPLSRREAKRTTRELMKGLLESSARLLVAGGAARLEVPNRDDTMVLDDSRYLPTSARHVGVVSLAQYCTCRAEEQVDWAYLSPAASLFAGVRTGRYRLGKDELVLDSNGESRISMEDLAVVLLDEVARPRHHRTGFTAAY